MGLEQLPVVAETLARFVMFVQPICFGTVWIKGQGTPQEWCLQSCSAFEMTQRGFQIWIPALE